MTLRQETVRRSSGADVKETTIAFDLVDSANVAVKVGSILLVLGMSVYNGAKTVI